jgi:hypothetical protein
VIDEFLSPAARAAAADSKKKNKPFPFTIAHLDSLSVPFFGRIVS